MAGNQLRTFKHYLEFPEEIRMFVIDEQEPDDRVRFTRCSKLCNQEAKASKNYIYELSFEIISFDHAKIQVKHGRRHGYSFHYRAPRVLWGEVIFKFCYDLVQEDQELWRETCDDSQNVFELAIEQLRELLEIYQNKIKKLAISDNEFLNPWNEYDFGIENLENLDDLTVFAPIDVQQFLSKIHHPLKRLYISKWKIFPLPENYEQIMQVRDLSWITVILDYEQLLRLSAEKAKIGLGNLTERDIFKFIRSWQDGSLGKEIERYAWYTTTLSNFEIEKFLRLLRVEDNDGEEIEIKHFTQDGKSATLQVTDECVIFST